MFNFLVGMMDWVQGSEAAKSSYSGYRHMAPLMWGMGGYSDTGFGYYLSLVFALIIQVLFVAILVAFLRWLWKKGDGKK